MYGIGFPRNKPDDFSEINKKCVLERCGNIIYRIVEDLYERKEINYNEIANSTNAKESPEMQNFRDMYLSFFLLLTEHDDAYYLESYLQWLLHYNRELGGTIKKLAPEVEKLVKEAIRPR